MKRFGNPIFRYNATKRHPLYVCKGDIVDVETDHPLTADEGGSLWKEGECWCGTAVLSLRPATQEELDWVPPHLRAINGLMSCLNL